MKKVIIATNIVFFLFSLCSLNAQQQKSRIAILPFSSIAVPDTEAQIITSLFEIALVKTGKFNVIEQNQIEEILNAQSQSLSGCVDDTCAVEVGKLLSAELIVLGQLSMLGGRYIANAKIIDVALGRNIQADSIDSPNISSMAGEAISNLAYKLAGLENSESQPESTMAYGEVFVQTTPSNAEVMLNGLSKGFSPLVIEKIPFGQVLLSAEKESLQGTESITINSTDLIEVNIDLSESVGRLFIKSSITEIAVYLDGEFLNTFGSGLFREIPIGEHHIELKSNTAFWESKVVIEKDKTLTVEANPTILGTLVYNLPENIEANILSGAYETIISGNGRISLTPGIYNLMINDDNFLPLRERIEIDSRDTSFFAPELTEIKLSGELFYSLPNDIQATIISLTDHSFRESVSSFGRIELATGRYSFIIDDDNYQPYTKIFTISRGEELEIIPTLEALEKTEINVSSAQNEIAHSTTAAFGILAYNLPERVEAELSQDSAKKIIAGNGRISLRTGRYKLVIDNPNYEYYQRIIYIRSNNVFNLNLKDNPIFSNTDSNISNTEDPDNSIPLFKNNDSDFKKKWILSYNFHIGGYGNYYGSDTGDHFEANGLSFGISKIFADHFSAGLCLGYLYGDEGFDEEESYEESHLLHFNSSLDFYLGAPSKGSVVLGVGSLFTNPSYDYPSYLSIRVGLKIMRITITTQIIGAFQGLIMNIGYNSYL